MLIVFVFMEGDAIKEFGGAMMRRMGMNRRAVLIIGINLFPVLGVMFFDWSVHTALFQYWLESVVVYAIGLVRLLVVIRKRHITDTIQRLQVVIFALFFGGWAALQLPMMQVLLFDGPVDSTITSAFIYFASLYSWPLMIAVLGAYLWQYLRPLYRDFIRKREYVQQDVSQQFSFPLRRYIVISGAIVLGNLLVTALGSAAVVIIPLVLFKCWSDIVIPESKTRYV